MYSEPWNCCRTCLNTQNLHAIFAMPEHSEKYTNAVFNVTGVKVEFNDTLPKEMCSNCINFINDSIKFRRKCEETQIILMTNRNCIKIETNNFKIEENHLSIDIDEELDDDFKDFDDNITLNTLQYHGKLNNHITDNEKEKIFNRDIEVINRPLLYHKKRKIKDKEVDNDVLDKSQYIAEINNKKIRSRVDKDILCDEDFINNVNEKKSILIDKPVLYNNREATGKIIDNITIQLQCNVDSIDKHITDNDANIKRQRRNNGIDKLQYDVSIDKHIIDNSNEDKLKSKELLNEPALFNKKRKTRVDSLKYQEESIDNNVRDNEGKLDKDMIDKPILFVKKRKTRVTRVSKKESGKVKIKEEIECEYCHKVLTSKLSLRNHYKIHTGFDIVCEHCGKKFITRRLLLMHCRAKHGYEKTDKCSYCDYKASNAEQVKIHERLHTGEKPFVCTTCSTGFHRKSSYLQHIAIHLPEKTVQCDQCPARFKSVTLMRIHKNRHRPSPYTFKCGVCDNSFARRRNVARHLQRVHGLPPDHHIHRIKIH